MDCEERARLRTEYRRALLDQSETTQRLGDLAATASGTDFHLLARERDRAAARALRARQAYEEHVARHGCGESDEIA